MSFPFTVVSENHSRSIRFIRQQSWRNNKSTGPDHIPPKLIKLAGTAMVPAAVALSRFSIERGVRFSSWKNARLAPIFKKDSGM